MNNRRNHSGVQRGLAALLALMLAVAGVHPTAAYAAEIMPAVAEELPEEAEAAPEAEAETEASVSASPETAEPEITVIETTVPEPEEETTEAAPDEEIPDLDYILDRPMTEEEIEAQMALEPNCLFEIPALSASSTVSLDIDHVEYDGVELNPDTLPEAYDARAAKGWNTSVKNQLPHGTCWAFSAVSSAETSLIRQGLTVGGSKATAASTDLSELQLVYFFYHPKTDELGNTAGDNSAPMGSTSFLNRGGHGIFSTLCMASWVGLVPERQVPYETASTSMSLDSSLCYERDVVHMQNSSWVSLTDLDAVKLLVRKCGNVSVSFNYDSNNFQYNTAAYYNPTETSTNHSVNIVGWDDHYSRENFVQTPSRDGAWLVKNNWGSGWGDNGYFWISYDERSFRGNAAFGYVYDFDEADNYDHIYQYDGSWNFVNRAIPSGSSVANVFTVSGHEVEELKAVSIALYSPNTEYSIQVYRNPVDGDPTSGIPVLNTPQTGLVSYAGYATIPLDQKNILFREGERYSVVFTLNESSGSTVRVLEDKTGENGGWIRFVNDTAPGQSYVKTSSSWKDLGASSDGSALGTSGETIRIKAFTKDREMIRMEGIELSAARLTLEEGESAELTAQILPADAMDAEEITWETSAPEIAVVENGKVQAVSAGHAVITAVSGSFRATCQVTVYAPSQMVTAIEMNKEEATLLVGEKLTLTVNPIPVNAVNAEETITWKSSKTSVATVSKGVVTAKAAGTAVISAIRKDGLRAECLVTVDMDKVPLRDVTTVGYRKIRIRWSRVPGAKSFRVYRRTADTEWTLVKVVLGSKAVSYTNKVPDPDTEYFYTVRACSGKTGYGYLGRYDAIGLSAKTRPEMTHVTGVTSTYKGLRITWDKVSCTGYRIYRRAEDGEWKYIKKVKGKSKYYYTDTKAKKGVTYYYMVRPYWSSGSKVDLSEAEEPGVMGIRS